MSKTSSRRIVADLEARLDAYGAIYVWLYKRHDRVLRSLEAETPALWEATAKAMERDGVRSISGEPPNRNSVRIAWHKVARHRAEAAERRAKAAAAKPATSHVSRPPGTWTPTEHKPPQAQPLRSTSRPDPPLPAYLRPTPGQASSIPLPTPQTGMVLGLQPEGDDPFANLTPDEAAKLARYGDLPFEAKLSVLRSYRQALYADRFTRVRT